MIHTKVVLDKFGQQLNLPSIDIEEYAEIVQIKELTRYSPSMPNVYASPETLVNVTGVGTRTFCGLGSIIQVTSATNLVLDITGPSEECVRMQNLGFPGIVNLYIAGVSQLHLAAASEDGAIRYSFPSNGYVFVPYGATISAIGGAATYNVVYQGYCIYTKDIQITTTNGKYCNIGTWDGFYRYGKYSYGQCGNDDLPDVLGRFIIMDNQFICVDNQFKSNQTYLANMSKRIIFSGYVLLQAYMTRPGAGNRPSSLQSDGYYLKTRLANGQFKKDFINFVAL